MVREGTERDGLEILVEALGMRQDVALPGFVPNPFPYMAHARVFVLSSGWEGMPGALIQALACGAPVVATDCEWAPRAAPRRSLGATGAGGERGGAGAGVDRRSGRAPAPDTSRGAGAVYVGRCRREVLGRPRSFRE